MKVFFLLIILGHALPSHADEWLTKSALVKCKLVETPAGCVERACKEAKKDGLSEAVRHCSVDRESSLYESEFEKRDKQFYPKLNKGYCWGVTTYNCLY